MDAAAASTDPVVFHPPPSPLYSSSSSPAPATYHSHHHHVTTIASFPILLLTVLGILTASALLLTYYVFVIRCCLSSSISTSRRRRRDDHELPVVHGGLDEPAIHALPSFTYGNKSGGGECAVCLGEFHQEEMVRLLPSCLHVFHVDCIDSWLLHGNASCPLCRADAITTTTRATHCPLMDYQLQTSEQEVVIMVAGAEEEGITAVAGSEGDAEDCR